MVRRKIKQMSKVSWIKFTSHAIGYFIWFPNFAHRILVMIELGNIARRKCLVL